MMTPRRIPNPIPQSSFPINGEMLLKVIPSDIDLDIQIKALNNGGAKITHTINPKRSNIKTTMPPGFSLKLSICSSLSLLLFCGCPLRFLCGLSNFSLSLITSTLSPAIDPNLRTSPFLKTRGRLNVSPLIIVSTGRN